MFRWIVNCFRRKPDFIIGRSDGPYLERWYLLPRNPVFNVYLHRFLRDDDDRALHDHPWHSLSIVLSGGYYEITPGPDGTYQRRWYPPGSTIFRRATHRHRVELAGTPRQLIAGYPHLTYVSGIGGDIVQAWTLFITGPRVREWGFWCLHGWVHWRDFTAGKDGERVGLGCDQPE